MQTLYKSLPKDMSPHGHHFKQGVWYKEEEIEICHRGFHASKRAIDAMGYVPCEWLALVEVKGKSEKQEDKECWSEMRIIKKYRWTKKDSVALSIFSAELCIENFEKVYPNDKRPREAIEAAKAWLKNPTAKNRSAAWSAAWSAARSAARSAAWSTESAARSAEYAAESAARSAARSAAWSAAWSAARSAESANKVLDRIEKWIHNRIGF